MNYLDLTKAGSMGFTQDRLAFMQQSLIDCITKLAAVLGDKLILDGVVDNGTGLLSAGWILYTGEPIYFEGGQLAAKVKIIETRDNVAFKNGLQQPVLIQRKAVCDVIGDFNFSELVRIQNLAATVALTNSLNTALTALSNAFNTHNHSYNNLTNLPAARIVHIGNVAVGDVTSVTWPVDENVTVPIPVQPNTNYMVLGTIVGTQSDLAFDNDVSFCVGKKQTSSFEVSFRDLVNGVQNISFDYVIIRTN